MNGGCVGLKGGGNSSILHLIGGGGNMSVSFRISEKGIFQRVLNATDAFIEG